MSATATPEQATWTPCMSMYANNQVQVIELELPGVKMKDVQLAIEPAVLIVSGTDKHGTFLRRIPLYYSAPLEQMEANLHQGVLEIRVPNPAV